MSVYISAPSCLAHERKRKLRVECNERAACSIRIYIYICTTRVQDVLHTARREKEKERKRETQHHPETRIRVLATPVCRVKNKKCQHKNLSITEGTLYFTIRIFVCNYCYSEAAISSSRSPYALPRSVEARDIHHHHHHHYYHHHTHTHVYSSALVWYPCVCVTTLCQYRRTLTHRCTRQPAAPSLPRPDMNSTYCRCAAHYDIGSSKQISGVQNIYMSGCAAREQSR
ncbi:unnamed protein product [Trichogramma brassicae]|uniref:Uncharacterized protein n=1 Tax=Trichogramma brassicae TaxID=86971 RepID=A0A6H5IIS2_9HYME|nr:unnamed protein product [Trichogramma brassicae]